MEKEMKMNATKKLSARVALVLSLFAATATFARTHVDALREKFASDDRSYVFVAMHRGDWRSYPENSIDAIKSCIAMGADVVELDVARTKDGRFVLSHDDTLDRATTGKGKVADHTLAELKDVRLRAGEGGLDAPATEYRMLTLEEALDAAKGKILINIDKFVRHPKEILDVVVAKGCISNILIKTDWSVKTLRHMVGEDYWKLIVRGDLLYMQIANFPDKSGRAADWFALEPRANSVYECCFSGEDGEKIVVGLQARFPESRIWVNTMWDSLCNGHADYKGLRGKPEACWGWCVDTAKATLIQTDAGKELIAYLKQRGKREIVSRARAESF